MYSLIHVLVYHTPECNVIPDKQDKEVNAKIDQLTQSVNLLGQMIAKAQTTGGNQ